MANPTTPEVAGLQLSNNDFSASPPGSLVKADNVTIDSKGIAQIRNGQRWLATLAAALDLPFALTEFQGAIIAQYGLSKTDTSQALGYVNGSSISAYSGGPYNPVGDDGSAADYMRMKFCLASLFLHFSCSSGPKCLETYNGTPRTAGLSRMPNPYAQIYVPSGSFAGFTTWLPYNSSAAFVTVLRRPTASGVSLLSAPSPRFVVTNRTIVAVAGLVRSGTTVTATVLPAKLITGVNGFPFPFSSGDSVTLSPVLGTDDPNFPSGTFVVTAIVNNTFTYTQAGAAVASTVSYDVNPGTLFAQVTAALPAAARAGDFVRIYRSLTTSLSTIEPGDDLYLADEHLLTAGDIVATYAAINDTTPESVLSDPLYTNPSDGDGLGADGGNLQPPIYGDVANFDGGTWYCDTLGQQSMSLEMLGVGGGTGVQDGDTLTINSTVFTFKNAPVGPFQVQIISDSTPSVNINWTTYFFAIVANAALKASGISVYANVSSSGFPGKFTIERTDWGASFGVKASRPGSWTPALSASVATTSTNGAQANGLVNSKSQQPEAVPAINYRTVGVPNFYARRIFGLRNALIILKEGDGIWSLNGSGGNYNLQQISTANTIAPDCACVFADSVWCYTDQGILRVSDTGGAQVVSRPIETELNRLASLYPTETYAWSFAVGYETERRIMFFVPFGAGTGQGGSPLLKAWCYSLATNAWTGPFYVENSTAISGLVTTGKKLHLGLFDTLSDTGRITIERKGAPVSPFSGLAEPPEYLRVADAQRTNAITSVSVNGDTTLLELSSMSGIIEGTGITQGTVALNTLAASKVIALRDDIGANVVQVAEENAGFTVAACLVFDPFTVEAQFLPQGDPAHRKALTRIVTLYKQASFANLLGSVVLETDQVQDELEISAAFRGFGLNPFGATPFGDPSPLIMDTNPNDPKYVNAGQFRVGFRLKEVWAAMKLQGMALQLDGATGPAGRGGTPG